MIIKKNLFELTQIYIEVTGTSACYPVLGWQDWVNMMMACDVPNNQCNQSTLDRVFIASLPNAQCKGLIRSDFFESLVRLGCGRYRDTNEVKQPGEAL